MSTERTSIAWASDADGIVTLTLDDPDQSANTMNVRFRTSMAQVIGRLQTEKSSIKGVIITSAKKTFFAGGDLKLLVASRAEGCRAHLRRNAGIDRSAPDARDARCARGRGLERLRSRRRSRDRARLSPAHRDR